MTDSGKHCGGSEPKFTAAQVAKALRKAGGMKPAAARMLGCHRVTVHLYIQRHPKQRDIGKDAVGPGDDAAGMAVDRGGRGRKFGCAHMTEIYTFYRAGGNYEMISMGWTWRANRKNHAES